MRNWIYRILLSRLIGIIRIVWPEHSIRGKEHFSAGSDDIDTLNARYGNLCKVLYSDEQSGIL